MGTIYRNGVPFVGSGGAGGVEMTQAEYDLLPTSEKMNGAIYFITDGDVSYPTASQMRYDNTESQIPSTTVQGAIDENRIEINDLKNGLIVEVTHVTQSGYSETNAINVRRVGNICFIQGTVAVNTPYTSSPGLNVITGLPRPFGAKYVSFPATFNDTTSASALRCYVNTSGDLYFRYGTASKNYDIDIAYICAL